MFNNFQVHNLGLISKTHILDSLDRNGLLGNRNNSGCDSPFNGEQITPPYDVLDTKCVRNKKATITYCSN